MTTTMAAKARSLEPRNRALGQALDDHRRAVWGICYRMTGVAADADDLVQETFARALTARPDRSGEPLRPWLARVAVRLAIDLLRRRRVRGYTGQWLPSPASTDEPDLEPTPDARYDTAESASYAFLVALERLTPLQRAVLLLRDVLGHTVRETAAVLSTTEGAVKVAHLRARRAMEGYDASRLPASPALEARTREALEGFIRAILAGDVASAEALLASNARAVTDGGGKYFAAPRVLEGASNVARFFVGIARGRGEGRAAWLRLNGLPALRVDLESPEPRVAPRTVLRLDLDAEGRIARIDVIAAPHKLTALPEAPGAPLPRP
ncbi:sigma-70 family RNA polymerase sigma factor [Anaeromyxobacter terrae]|uniref:sigma-70 family RNA polymerase sigma factor n=1 Tax=Anaeromyxobacter terrae TaxID=2925406 RepID=UPI001F55E32B|nr:sigma-70 family RNA polymerase sigma factor [Anaeromyxobacter sp. SG22]